MKKLLATLLATAALAAPAIAQDKIAEFRIGVLGGANATQVPFGNGLLCASGNLRRGDIVVAINNTATISYDNSTPKRSLTAFVGTNRKFQNWFRDPMGGGASFNTSNAVAIDILP
jgi:hypothetical protein